MDKAYACCGKEQPKNIANLPKYALHGRDACSMQCHHCQHARSFRTQSWGEDPTSRESLYHVSCTFEALAKQKKGLLPKVV